MSMHIYMCIHMCVHVYIICVICVYGYIAVCEMVNCLALYFLRQQMNYETLL